MLNFIHPPPLSLYIHIPWCIKKCPYCDFNSHTLRDEIPEEQYIKCLLNDLEQDLNLVDNRELISIFIGGGTPSLFSPVAIADLLKEINHRISFNKDIEITLEANPGTVEQTRFEGFRQAGINRLSIGCQSFQDDKLRELGRIHGHQEAVRAAQAASRAGFTNFNLDLMFGLPHQTTEDALADLETAISLQPTHLSWYQLTLEPNTLFYSKPPPLPFEEELWHMQLQGQNCLSKAGFIQYEVSAYSFAEHQCQHNLNYWQFGDYLGIGAGAHSKLTDMTNQRVIRTSKIKHPKQYLTAHDNFINEKKIILAEELIFEFMLNALRLSGPIAIKLFTERTSLPWHTIAETIAAAEQRSFLKMIDESITLTLQGRNFLNDVVEMFLPNK